MYFRDPKKELPKYYEVVFVKTVGNDYDFASYSPIRRWYPDDDADVVFSIDVIGWMPISELDSVEIK